MFFGRYTRNIYIGNSSEGDPQKFLFKHSYMYDGHPLARQSRSSNTIVSRITRHFIGFKFAVAAHD